MCSHREQVWQKPERNHFACLEHVTVTWYRSVMTVLWVEERLRSHVTVVVSAVCWEQHRVSICLLPNITEVSIALANKPARLSELSSPVYMTLAQIRWLACMPYHTIWQEHNIWGFLSNIPDTHALLPHAYDGLYWHTHPWNFVSIYKLLKFLMSR